MQTDMTVYPKGGDAGQPLAFGRAVFAIHHVTQQILSSYKQNKKEKVEIKEDFISG